VFGYSSDIYLLTFDLRPPRPSIGPARLGGANNSASNLNYGSACDTLPEAVRQSMSSIGPVEKLQTCHPQVVGRTARPGPQRPTEGSLRSIRRFWPEMGTSGGRIKDARGNGIRRGQDGSLVMYRKAGAALPQLKAAVQSQAKNQTWTFTRRSTSALTSAFALSLVDTTLSLCATRHTAAGRTASGASEGCCRRGNLSWPGYPAARNCRQMDSNQGHKLPLRSRHHSGALHTEVRTSPRSVSNPMDLSARTSRVHLVRFSTH